MVRRYAMGRLGIRADAAAVLLFAGEDAGWVTGQVLSVNGGYPMLSPRPDGRRPIAAFRALAGLGTVPLAR